MEAFSYPLLLELMNDNEQSVQVQALNALRNVCCGAEDIDRALEACGEDIWEVVEEKLESEGIEAARLPGEIVVHPGREVEKAKTADDIALQTLYTIANIATGSQSTKSTILSRPPLLRRIFSYFDSPRPDLRIAAVWVIHNLTWPDEEGAQDRIQSLRHYDVQQKLWQMWKGEGEGDVRERVAQVLKHFGMNIEGIDVASVMRGSHRGLHFATMEV